MADAPASLEDLRQAMLAIDAELVALLGRRAALSLAVGECKQASGQSDVFRPGREAALMRQLEAMNCGPLPIDHLRVIYREILSSSRTLQRPERVAFLGPPDLPGLGFSPAQSAGRELLGSLTEFQPKPSLDAVFAVVADGSCALGVVPLENAEKTLEGCFLRYPGLHILVETDSSGGRFAVIGRTPSENR